MYINNYRRSGAHLKEIESGDLAEELKGDLSPFNSAKSKLISALENALSSRFLDREYENVLRACGILKFQNWPADCSEDPGAISKISISNFVVKTLLFIQMEWKQLKWNETVKFVYAYIVCFVFTFFLLCFFVNNICLPAATSLQVNCEQ